MTDWCLYHYGSNQESERAGCKVGVYGASTTGEETTKTGAFWTSTRINPTLAIVVDVTYTSDRSGMNPAEDGNGSSGGWTGSLQQSDRGKNSKCQNGRMCKKVGIPVQREAASRLSYTDGDKIHFSNQAYRWYWYQSRFVICTCLQR